MVFSAISSVAPPLKRPALCASVTVPETREPTGMTDLPPTTNGCVSVALNGSPRVFVFELRVSCRRTVKIVPAGTMIGFGCGLGDGGGGGRTCAAEVSTAGGGVACADNSGDEDGGFLELVSSTGFLLHAVSNNTVKATVRNCFWGFMVVSTVESLVASFRFHTAAFDRSGLAGELDTRHSFTYFQNRSNVESDG
jgi:hypothetical protein